MRTILTLLLDFLLLELGHVDFMIDSIELGLLLFVEILDEVLLSLVFKVEFSLLCE